MNSLNSIQWLKGFVCLILVTGSLRAEHDTKSMSAPEAILDRPEGSVFNSVGRISLSIKSTITYMSPGLEHAMNFNLNSVVGSGGLLTPCLAFTNQHVVDGVNDANLKLINDSYDQLKADTNNSNFSFQISRTNLKFKVGKTNSESQNFAEEIPGRVVALGSDGKDISPEPDKIAQDVRPTYDWALIKLDHPVSGHFKNLIPVAKNPEYLKKCPRFIMTGYPAELSERDLRSPTDCRLDIASRTAFWLDCANMPGASGGPVFCDDPNESEPVFVGLATMIRRNKTTGRDHTFSLHFFNNPEFITAVQKYGSCH